MSANGRDWRRSCIAVIGDAQVKPDSQQEILAYAVGKELVNAGYRLVTGGMGGVMEAAHRGARDSINWYDGSGIGLLPGTDSAQANPFVDVAIPTGLDHGRNLVVAQSDAIIAIGGGAGTLSEMALAWIHRRLIIALRCGGWSERLANQRIDERIRYKELTEDRVFAADSAEEALRLLVDWLPRYTKRHVRIA